MKKTLIGAACAVALAVSATNVNALTIGDAFYIGHVLDGIPSSPELEVTYINSLLDIAAGAAPAACTQAGSETCDRVGSTLNVSGFSDATITGNVTDDSGSNSVDVTGFEYLIAKYDAKQAGSYVWYVGGLSGVQTVPSSAGDCGSSGCGLSHIGLFNSTTAVPDGGLTLGLLGLSMLGIGYLRRRVG